MRKMFIKSSKNKILLGLLGVLLVVTGVTYGQVKKEASVLGKSWSSGDVVYQGGTKYEYINGKVKVSRLPKESQEYKDVIGKGKIEYNINNPHSYPDFVKDNLVLYNKSGGTTPGNDSMCDVWIGADTDGDNDIDKQDGANYSRRPCGEAIRLINSGTVCGQVDMGGYYNIRILDNCNPPQGGPQDPPGSPTPTPTPNPYAYSYAYSYSYSYAYSYANPYPYPYAYTNSYTNSNSDPYANTIS